MLVTLNAHCYDRSRLRWKAHREQLSRATPPLPRGISPRQFAEGPPGKWRGRTPPRNLRIRRTPRIAVALGLALVAGLYLFDLEHTPVYFGGDEAHFAVGAQAIVATGRNVNGDLLPVFFNLADPLSGKQQPWGDTWYQPLLHYLTAIFVALLPFTVATVRLPMAIVGGIVPPWLMYRVAGRLSGHELSAVVAALIVALAPTHVVLSRQALDYVLPLPFVIGWICVSTRS